MFWLPFTGRTYDAKSASSKLPKNKLKKMTDFNGSFTLFRGMSWI